MTNTPFLFYSLDAVKFFNKPFFDGENWYNLNHKKEEPRIFLSETRAAMLRVPIGQNEEPTAYIYSVYGKGEECYIPIYDRTNKIDLEYVYSNEIVFNS